MLLELYSEKIPFDGLQICPQFTTRDASAATADPALLELRSCARPSFGSAIITSGRYAFIREKCK
jgi:hypothetical protein